MAKWRVMTVDDSAAMLTIIATYLEGSEFEVVASERDGVTAVERFAQERPDIVLLDSIMPGQSGGETLERILAIDPDAFVVIMSSRRTEGAVQECLQTGARSFLQKPFAQGDLVEFMLDLVLVA